MILSDKTIKSLLKSNELCIEPLAENAIQPASVDCRIGRHYLAVDDHQYNAKTITDETQWWSPT